MRYFLSTFSLFAFVLTACEPTIPETYVYGGVLSAQHPVTVKEAYSPSGKRNQLSLFLAYLDVDGDKKFDLQVDLKNGEIEALSDLQNLKRLTTWAAEQSERPSGMAAPEALIGIYEATRLLPLDDTLDKLYSPQTTKTQAWQLAMRLRGAKGDLLTQSISRAGAALAGERFPEQSAFLLAGLGEDGARELLKVLQQTNKVAVAEKAAFALYSGNFNAAPLLPDLIAALEKETANEKQSNTAVPRHLFLAIESATLRNPAKMRPHMQRLSTLAKNRDDWFNAQVKKIWNIVIDWEVTPGSNAYIDGPLPASPSRTFP
ncbi:MAG: hypothetical protein LBV54_06000 [Puniceicoccales bacterium]|jgi:plasmid maintenance system killer protein|nr:hypothetical protein [Puniceicoccales bacterium]